MRRRSQSIMANPVLIGAVTVLVVVIAVYLAYNANNGLPFVPTYELNAKVPNAGKLVAGNEVREGGFRVGVVERIANVRRPDGSVGAELRLKLDEEAGPVPVDSSLTIRPRSALGLKYVELHRGRSPRTLENGSDIEVGGVANTVEIEDFFGIFDTPTREYSQRNLTEFGGALAARGVDLNRTIETFPELLDVLAPVAANLADPRTRLGFFFQELADAARVSAPVADQIVEGLSAGADVFEAFSRHPDRLAQTISRSPATLDVGTRSFIAQRPFLRHLAGVSDELEGVAVELRASLPGVNSALAAGTQVLPRTPELNARLVGTLGALEELATAPTTGVALRALRATMETLRPQLRYLGPFVTTCNYWNYWWTFLADNLTDQDSTGQLQRVLSKNAPPQQDALATFGADNYANTDEVNPVERAIFGDGVEFHNQVYGAAIAGDGRADCESGQRGYPRRLAHRSLPPEYNVVLNPHTPGLQGPTFTGRARVPDNQTFDAVPHNRRAVKP